VKSTLALDLDVRENLEKSFFLKKKGLMFPALVFSEALSTPIEVNSRYYYSTHSQPISMLKGFNFSDPENFSTPDQMS